MNIEKILAISGKPGLYELKIQTRTGFVAESLLDGKKFPVTVTHNISALNEIAIYTYEEEVPLRIILKSIGEKEGGKEAFTKKILQYVSNKKQLTYFECKHLFINEVLDSRNNYINDNILGKFYRKDFDL